MIDPVGDGPMADPAAPRCCDTCGRLVGPEEARGTRDEASRCPTCGEALVSGTEDADAPVRAPWHFKMLLVGTVGYLIYRLIWFIGWLHHHA